MNTSLAQGSVTALAFSPDGKRLAVGLYGKVELYDTSNWSLVSTYTKVEDTVRALAFHPDGKVLAVGSGLPARTGDIVFWDTSGAQKPKELPPQKDTIEALTFRKDGKALLVAGNDSKAHLYPDLPYGYGPTLDEHNGRVQAVAFSPNDGWIFITGAMDKIVKVWDAKARKVNTVVNFDQSQGGITGLAFLPNGNQFIGSSLDGHLYWWGVNYDPKKRVFGGYHYRTIKAHENGIWCLSSSANGQRLITGGADHLVSIWKADDGARLKDFKEATQPLYAVALTADGKIAAAGGREGMVRLYDVESGKLITTLPVSATRPTDKSSPSTTK